ncbi:hypothetical protein CALVIDRAFT_489949 [Calocera viscosa TUFC12733]|uniref:Glycosyltransferase 61 catalytic domain-containing protein n=1 Tax=Calocera viscosa (strain TUFC12733) TaxID=1330018 RepID=A0A167GQQ4_CALVF|nr:hypothetical protein CALVIDRAFT_489949 [Calocera viscosa TUFC12733]
MYWGSALPPETRIVSHSPGYTIFENLYMLNGTTFVVTTEPEEVPEFRYVLGSGADNPGYLSPVQDPTEKDMQVITPQQAKDLFGTGAMSLQGNTLWAHESAQFLPHYYHFCAELFFGMWRAYTSLASSISEDGQTTLPPPTRWIMPHVDTNAWRDYARMNQYVLFAALPSIQLLFHTDFVDMAEFERPYVLERVIMSDRSAAIRGSGWMPAQRLASQAFDLRGVDNWWEPVRNAVVRFATEDADTRVSVGNLPGPAVIGRKKASDKPVITYVSRQNWNTRSLRAEDHQTLVDALYRLRELHGYEVNVVTMDTLNRHQQIALAARTTILIGPHGNGLTALLWMKPTPKSAVMEFFFPTGWAYDYEWTARHLGIKHYGWHNDTFDQYPNVPGANHYPPGYQGTDMPIDGEAVAREIHKRLSGQAQ